MRIVATAGHVDHGKSSLVRALTGTDPDRWEEERRRGLTIDLGFAHTELPGGRALSFIDVPGHVRFIRNMLAGVGGVDASMFVVAATEGWKPQSEEHLRILDVLGVRHGIVVLSKRDLVDDEWLALQELDVRDRLAGTFLDDAPIVTASSHASADGLDAVRSALCALVDTTPPAVDQGRPRLWIDRVFAAKGSGTVVTGTLTGGGLQVDQRLTVDGREVRVRGIQSHGAPQPQVAPGHRVALNLSGVEHHDLRRGMAVVDLAQWRPTTRLDASLHVLHTLGHAVGRKGAYTAHIGSGEFPVRLRVLGADTIAPGDDGVVRLHVIGRGVGIPLVPGDRFVLRESGRDETVGGGEVLDVAPVLPASRARPDRSVTRVVAEHGWIDADDLTALVGGEQQPEVGRWVVSPAVREAAEARLRALVDGGGDHGIDVAALDERERALLSLLDDIVVEAGRARVAGRHDPFADHPAISVVRAGGVAPPAPTGVPPGELRELVRRGALVERDGLYFHPDAISEAARAAAHLLASAPTGFTVGEFREALGITRKHAVPLAAELDARGITRRRDDRRIAGPRLPAD